MLKHFRKLFGLQPPLPGLENLLEDVKRGTRSVEDAADQIRDLAAQPHIPPWFPRVFRIMGAIFAMVGIGFGIYSVYFSFGTKETDGTVIEMKGMTQQSPVVEYNVDGQRFTFHSSISSSPPAYGVGDKVTILYDPDDPTTAQINTFHDRWLFPLIFTGAGLTAVAFSFAIPQVLLAITGTGLTRRST